MNDRFVVLALPHARSAWFHELQRWATAGALPVEVVACVSVEEALARLAGDRPYSALVVDVDRLGVDRDLVDRAHDCGCAVLFVGPPRPGRDWRALGADAALPSGFSREDLVGALAQVARPIHRADAITSHPTAGDDSPPGHLVAVTGPGGTGASTIAIAIAQGLAARSGAGEVLLADLCLWADQAMLHGTPDIVPGLPELVEGHRLGHLSPDDHRVLVYDIVGRGYHLLLGVRRHHEWAALRPRAVDAALEGLRRTYPIVVADIEPDLEGHERTGSLEVEERNHLARSTVDRATTIITVGAGSMKAVHALSRLIADVVEHGVEVERVVPVVNRAPRHPSARAEIARAIADLVAPALGREADLHPVVFIPDRRAVEASVRDATALPTAVVAPLVGLLAQRLNQPSRRPTETLPVVPGMLGSWATEEAS
jgi:MinD-like ATPase involved in chromosome partitioning or flagellar assembly